MSERKPPELSWESFSEQKIRAAQESGEFENLPGLGKPLRDLDGPPEDDWWLREKLRREEISVLPPALEIQRIAEQTMQALVNLRTESEVRRELTALNEKIREVHYHAWWGPPNRTMPVDIDQAVTDWKRQRAARNSQR